ncbi:ABCB family ABC transporter ATP-binding protein/permease [Piscinibacterium candidicorallinum]|uniref:ABCB family ABC transporter ATP-binding protein/permease n=1 Tax=Piscinibacterium candidicorallinum TaxID=1793872 RepID=A0ABV7H893_9BURK
MRRAATRLEPAAPAQNRHQSDWAVIRSLLPYLMAYKGRVAFALSCLIAAKFANVGVPLILKDIVDRLTLPGVSMLVAVPFALVLAYGAARLMTSLFQELREFFFINVTQRAVRTLARQSFDHLHSLSLRFHLSRRTGQVTREIDHGVRGVSTLISYTLYSIFPLFIELGLVIGILAHKFGWVFPTIVAGSLTAYVIYTVSMTNWRTKMRREWNELETRAQSKAVDSLLNFETVKYFNNERFESERYDETLKKSEAAAIRSQQSLNLLNAGQQFIIAIALTLMVWQAVVGVQAGRMTVGDLVLVNAFLIQLFIPLNFLGVLYREIKQALADLERMFNLLHVNREVSDAPDARPLQVSGGEIVFEQVGFAYDPERPILQGVDLRIAPGTTCAVVGASGAGKSTLARLLFRFYDVNQGALRIDGQDIRSVTQESLRKSIGIVPQDTVLFNDTIAYNIAYGKPGATQSEIEAAAVAAQIHDFIQSLPQGYDTVVGERGLKLSGGEKQRVAIARTLLKNPPILIFDEATSALDSRTEQAIAAQLKAISADRTTLVIAHRLSTIVDADQIVVMEAGRVIERGRFDELVSAGGAFARMWALQSGEEQDDARAEELVA